MEQADMIHLFNTSWTLHRLSPLHHGKDSKTLLNDETALRTYATRLRDHLTGDALAGLQTRTATAEDDALSKTGALKDCFWQPISTRDDAPSTAFPGILITLEYENIIYKAALLAEPESDPSHRKDSTSLPLLLTRFPSALRQTFISFLATNFDTYCSNLRLSSAFLCSGLEMYVDVLREKRGSMEDAIKELQLTLAFSASIAPDLKTLNVSVSRVSLAEFLRDQSAPKSRTLQQKLKSPFIANLTDYLETHLAMKLDLDGSSDNKVSKKHVRLSKVACAAFVLGSEGRLKLVVAGDQDDGDGDEVGLPFEASGAILRSIIRRAVIGDQAAT
ncbi:hypothetical protein PENANT_c002G03297 [Penicillium antarcticum]|uniref:Uncharacterized protein n=1 Tax=Penicillium antarcticum TaxID=416450 RepID=A0A1V6QJQ6_9EURO|nr:uncharacterized protein N7508_008490 [Penicillium antarcticum]KAJ5293669.1 hypothetical protein N7508_008490 [Penicillium antarcticum]OQD89443.1 hypothetical protein PENANT_c002G03297 [Penicillium antarcticum]